MRKELLRSAQCQQGGAWSSAFSPADPLGRDADSCKLQAAHHESPADSRAVEMSVGGCDSPGEGR